MTAIFRAVGIWQERWRRARGRQLQYRKSCASIFIEDGRRPAVGRFDYTDGQAALYEFCMDAKTQPAIATRFGEGEWLAAALTEFCERDLMVYLDDQYLSLALPKNPYL